MATKRNVTKPRTQSKDMPVDSEIRAAGARINYVPTLPAPTHDRELHSQLLAITSRISEILAMIEMWDDNPKHCEVASLFEQLSELNLEVWRVRWEGTLSDHVVAS